MKAHSKLLPSKWMRCLFFVMLSLACLPAWSTCWRVDWMVERARQIAQQHFPGLLGFMPDVFVCEAFDFPNRAIGGRFSSGRSPVIEIPEYSLHGDLNNILAHELGHAEANRLGVDDHSLDGHGVGWMRVMIQAGLEHEAQRVVGYLPAAAQALYAARQQVTGQTAQQGPPDSPNGYVQCYIQRQFWVFDGRTKRLITQLVPVWCAR